MSDTITIKLTRPVKAAVKRLKNRLILTDSEDEFEILEWALAGIPEEPTDATA